MNPQGQMRLILDLFATFFRIGLFTFGGGYAMIPLIEREAVENKNWITSEDVLDILAIAESTPGVLAINSGTFVGYKVAGVWGSLAATLGVTLPSFIVISLIAVFLMPFMSSKWVDCAFQGIRAGVIVLMINAVLKLSKACPKTLFSYVLIGAAFLLAAFTPIDIVYVLILAALSGLAMMLITARSKGGEAK